MSFEIGTWAHTRLNLFGVGCTTLDSVMHKTFADNEISANSGWKAITGGTVKYINLLGDKAVSLSGSSDKQRLVE